MLATARIWASEAAVTSECVLIINNALLGKLWFGLQNVVFNCVLLLASRSGLLLSRYGNSAAELEFVVKVFVCKKSARGCTFRMPLVQT